MSDSFFIDTNVLLYAYDRDAGAKHEVAKKLVQQRWEQASGVISIQVLCEFFVRATRKDNAIINFGRGRIHREELSLQLVGCCP